jgi:hypothetical protein
MSLIKTHRFLRKEFRIRLLKMKENIHTILTLKTGATRFSETVVTIYKTSQRHSPQKTKLDYTRVAIWWSLQSELLLNRLGTPLAYSCVFASSSASSVNRLMVHSAASPYNLADPRLHVKSWNEELTTALHLFRPSWGLLRGK